MKYLLQILLFICLPVLLFSCEEGVFGPRPISCLETGQTSGIVSSERIYDNHKITELRNVQNGSLLNYYSFTYGTDGRISESQYYDVVNNTQQVPDKITYNASGKWVKVTSTNTTGDIYIYEAEYNNQDQIQKYTSSTSKAGTVTVNYTIAYEWQGGNNTVYTFTSPTQKLVTRYEFDLNRENKRRKEQEKTAFLAASVAFNKNMYKRIVSSSTNLASGTTTETITDYEYEYNEEGYPMQLTRTITSGSTAPNVVTTYFDYTCD